MMYISASELPLLLAKKALSFEILNPQTTIQMIH
jgi:hypothetical protein